MFTTIGLIPTPEDIKASIHGSAGHRIRTIEMTPVGMASLHVESRGVLDALQAALDEIRADMDREEAADAGNELAAS
jgi:hypothetical protein